MFDLVFKKILNEYFIEMGWIFCTDEHVAVTITV